MLSFTKQNYFMHNLFLQLRHGERYLRSGNGTTEEHRTSPDRGSQRSIQLHGSGRHADCSYLHSWRERLRGERRSPADTATDPVGDTTRPGAQRGSSRRGGSLQKILELTVPTLGLLNASIYMYIYIYWHGTMLWSLNVAIFVFRMSTIYLLLYHLSFNRRQRVIFSKLMINPVINAGY